MKWITKASNITTIIKAEVDFTLPELSTKNVVTWNCKVYDSAKYRCDMILEINQLTELVLNLKFSNRTI